MAQQFSIAYYYVNPEDNEKLRDFREASGDSEKTLVTQYVRGWIGRNREYYLNLCKLDAQKREILAEKWVEIVTSIGVDALPPYKQPINNGEIPPNPLAHVTLSANKIQRNLNYIVLGRQNIALLRIAILYDRDTVTGYISRIVAEHVTRNWSKLYQAQAEAEKSNNWF